MELRYVVGRKDIRFIINISDLIMRISERKYLKAKETIAKYEKQQNQYIVDRYFNDYGTLKEAMSLMERICNEQNRIVYCYLKSNNRYVITLTEIIEATPVHVLQYWYDIQAK